MESGPPDPLSHRKTALCIAQELECSVLRRQGSKERLALNALAIEMLVQAFDRTPGIAQDKR
jgi:hypothetical protein